MRTIFERKGPGSKQFSPGPWLFLVLMMCTGLSSPSVAARYELTWIEETADSALLIIEAENFVIFRTVLRENRKWSLADLDHEIRQPAWNSFRSQHPDFDSRWRTLADKRRITSPGDDRLEAQEWIEDVAGGELSERPPAFAHLHYAWLAKSTVQLFDHAFNGVRVSWDSRWSDWEFDPATARENTEWRSILETVIGPGEPDEPDSLRWQRALVALETRSTEVAVQELVPTHLMVLHRHEEGSATLLMMSSRTLNHFVFTANKGGILEKDRNVSIPRIFGIEDGVNSPTVARIFGDPAPADGVERWDLFWPDWIREVESQSRRMTVAHPKAGTVVVTLQVAADALRGTWLSRVRPIPPSYRPPKREPASNFPDWIMITGYGGLATAVAAVAVFLSRRWKKKRHGPITTPAKLLRSMRRGYSGTTVSTSARKVSDSPRPNTKVENTVPHTLSRDARWTLERAVECPVPAELQRIPDASKWMSELAGRWSRLEEERNSLIKESRDSQARENQLTSELETVRSHRVALEEQLDEVDEWQKRLRMMAHVHGLVRLGVQSFQDRCQNPGVSGVLSAILEDVVYRATCAEIERRSDRSELLSGALATTLDKVSRFEGRPIREFAEASKVLREFFQEEIGSPIKSPERDPDQLFFSQMIFYLKDYGGIDLMPFYYDFDEGGRGIGIA